MQTVKKAALVQDMSGFGRCSMTVAIAVLSAMGVQCCPLQTAYLSAHTGYPGGSFLDMTPQIADALDHWAALGLTFDGIYSGFLGSEQQLHLVARLIRRFRRPGGFVLVDPVMGDNGAIYRTYTPALCAGMRSLADLADVITPNITEGAVLLGLAPTAAPRTQAEAEDWVKRLSQNGRRSVILTGLAGPEDTLGALSLDRRTGELRFFARPRVDCPFSGTGDLFASVVTGALLQGKTLFQAAEAGVSFVADCAAATPLEGADPMAGVDYEPRLGALVPRE